jgi:ATP-binding cassette subfamily B protein
VRFPFFYQSGTSDCGATCLRMITAYFNKFYEQEFLNKRCRTRVIGISMLDLSLAAKSLGFICIGAKIKLEQLKEIVQIVPVILHWNKVHFVVIYKSPKPNKNGRFFIADPARGLLELNEAELTKNWIIKKTMKRRKDSKRRKVQSVGYAMLCFPA